MSENLCYTDAYARVVEAVVVDVDADANAVLLDRMVFTRGADLRDRWRPHHGIRVESAQ